MKVHEAVANAFVKEGATTVFGLLGDGQLSWWPVMAKHPGVRLIDAREEGSGVAMAEGYARATGKVGVCSVTHGPGLARCALSLIACARGRTPVVVHTATTTFNNEDLQYLNQDRFVTGCEAGYIEVMKPDYAEEAVRQAFYQARTESRPIVLSIPVDVQGKECDSEGEDYVTSAALDGAQQRIRPARDRVQQAVKMISEAKRPVIVVGRGVSKDARALEAIERLGKRIGALIASTLYAKGTLSQSEWYTGVSGLFATRAALRLFQETDCVIAMGAGLNIRTLGGGYTYGDARFVHIDVQRQILLGTDRSADCYVQGDAAETVEEIEAALAQQGFQRDGFRTAATKTALRGQFRDPGEFEIESGTVDLREALTILDEKLPSNVGLVTGSAHNFSFPVWHMQKARELQVSVTNFTGVGQVIGNAVGAAVGWKHPVVAVDGDGSALQNIQELDTAARLGVKLLYFIVNDEAYGAEYHKLKAKGYDNMLSVVPTPDFGAVARAFGCRGRQAKTLDEVAAGIDEFMAGDGPMVLDVRISRNVISIPYRRLHFGQDV